MFPFAPYERGVAPGSEFVVFDVPGAGRFGVSICYDMWFPETTRSLASLGAEVILHPTLTNTIDRDAELAIARASAATNQCYFVDINVAGALGVGRSVICGPGGEVIHQAGSGREVIAFEVDFAHVRRCRERGWQGLGQPLKSFRDSTVAFPAYGAAAAPSDALCEFGASRVGGAAGGVRAGRRGHGGEVIHQAGSGREVIAFEVDFAHVRRCRERGWQGLGQPLKSFRDSTVAFPAYGAAAAPSDALDAFGPLRLPGAG